MARGLTLSGQRRAREVREVRNRDVQCSTCYTKCNKYRLDNEVIDTGEVAAGPSGSGAANLCE